VLSAKGAAFTGSLEQRPKTQKQENVSASKAPSALSRCSFAEAPVPEQIEMKQVASVCYKFAMFTSSAHPLVASPLAERGED